MTIFDLLFIVLFLISVVTLGVAGVSLLRGRGAQAIRILRRWGLCAAIYFAVVFVVSSLLPTRVLQVGDEQCSDDWCMAVDKVNRTATPADTTYEVSLRLFNRARRAAQRENGLAVYLIDQSGTRYDPLPDASATPLNVRLQPLQSVNTTRTFKVPADAHDLRLVVAHEGGFQMRWVIIGRNPFDKRTVVRMD